MIVNSSKNIKETSNITKVNESKGENETKHNKYYEKKKKRLIVEYFFYETCFSFVYILKDLPDYIKCLLTTHKFTFVLPGNLHNNKMKYYFGLVKGLSGLN